jgi:hypothetical protein
MLRGSGGCGWRSEHRLRSKEDAGHEGDWFAFIQGEDETFPERLLEEAIGYVESRVAAVEADQTDLLAVSDEAVHYLVHHWQIMNPVTTEALVLLSWGAPQHLYNGGLPYARLRYFDAERRRPGLPEDVAALVRSIRPDATVVELVNTGSRPRTLVVQAGGFAEHRFDSVRLGSDGEALPVNGRHVAVHLPPSGRITLSLAMSLNVSHPTYTALNFDDIPRGAA